MTAAVKTENGKVTRLNPGVEFEALMERLDAITPLLKENGEKNEEIGHLTDETVNALQEVGAFRIGIPESLGGYELTPRQTIQMLNSRE